MQDSLETNAGRIVAKHASSQGGAIRPAVRRENRRPELFTHVSLNGWIVGEQVVRALIGVEQFRG